MVTGTFEEALSWWVLGLIDSSHLANAAASGLEEGFDSPALRSLAGLDRSESDQAGALLQLAAKEVGVTIRDRREAANHLARRLSERILKGQLEAFDGTRKLAEISRAVESADFHDLDAFVYVDSEAEDRPQDKAFFLEAILSEARRWAR
jgi:hypothetical protein